MVKKIYDINEDLYNTDNLPLYQNRFMMVDGREILFIEGLIIIEEDNVYKLLSLEQMANYHNNKLIEAE